MSVVDIVDKNGSTSRLWKYNDTYLPMAVNGSPAHHLPALYNWWTRPDDVFVCSYPKSGKLIKIFNKNDASIFRDKISIVE